MCRIDGSGNLHRAQRALCDLGGCDGDGSGRGVQEGASICIYTADSLPHTAETHTAS